MDSISKSFIMSNQGVTGAKETLNLHKAGQEFSEVWEQDIFVKAYDVENITDLLDSRGILRKPEEAVAFCHKFNEALGLKPDDLKTKYAIMKQDSFTFYRAMPSLFYYDIHRNYANSASLLDRPAPNIIINGDLHWMNLGTYRGDKGFAVWGIDDFDQADKGSPEWDLERLAVSACLSLRKSGKSDDEEVKIVKEIGRKYFETIAKIAEEKEPHPCYLRSDETRGVIRDAIKSADSVTQKDFLKKYVKTLETGERRFIYNEKVRPVSPELAAHIKNGLNDYAGRLSPNVPVANPLHILDIAEKLGSGGSSYGLKRYYALVANAKPWKEPIIIELKQLLPSSVNDQSGNISSADGKNVVESIKALGGYANPLTGYTSINGVSFLVRELEPQKSKVSPDELQKYDDFETYFKQAAKTLAFAHAYNIEQARKINNWVGEDRKQAIKNLVDFSRRYAKQVEADYEAFRKS